MRKVWLYLTAAGLLAALGVGSYAAAKGKDEGLIPDLPAGN